MADDRYSWLDEDAAERLLRGERVDAGRGHGARELDDLLSAAAMTAAAPAPGTALPGEEAAVAAFRQASAGRSTRDTAAAGNVAEEAAEDGIPVVRRVPGGASRTERSRIGRPFRRGLAVALAGCALGGVAVAAGTGVLPTPFHSGEPAPSPSVSAAVTPSPLESRAHDTDGPDGGTRSPQADPESADPATPASPGATGGRPSPGDGTVRLPVPDLTPGGGGLDGGDKAERRAAALAFCRDYAAGRTPAADPERVRGLERAAGGTEKLRLLCKQYVQKNGLTGGGLGGSHTTTGGTGGSSDGGSSDGGSSGDGGSGGSGDTGGSAGTGEDQSSGGQGGDDDGSHQGYAPGVSVSPSPLEDSSADPSPSETASPEQAATPSATPSPTG
ncbi:hypothetical protein C3486_11695 [Streptomyces sp. Ru73]|uniref:hypothetical protein n=1 Tax=Streptomyces sp. Ru73 TaxID=2080748 RepID=UPI000CDE4389|nr:hypothetical protein [Streptomyces sp. Ru73]POX40850.1 hypothetical protein C3486_11695 [Streptomyces sp. Ru73]